MGIIKRRLRKKDFYLDRISLICLFLFLFILIDFNLVLAQEEPPPPKEEGGGGGPLGAGGSSKPLPYVYDPVVPEQGELKQDDAFLVNLYSGAASYTYQIRVPPGTNDLQPQIFIFYNSHKTKERPSILGTGWELSRGYIQRDANSTFNNSADDEYKLILDGASYDLIYVPNEIRYHTKIESFMFIKNMSNGNNTNGQYWIVKTKGGTTYRFGFNNNSESVSNQYNYIWRWSLDLVNDTHNNKIFYTYRENPYPNDLGAVYPDKIEYNNDAKRKIEFILEDSDRPDIRTIYEDGNQIKESRRLKEIIVNANNNLTRRYVIKYNTHGVNDTISIISNITQYGTNNLTTLPPAKFGYELVEAGYGNNTAYAPVQCFVSSTGTDQGVRLVDLNGDGLVDMVKGFDSPCIDAAKQAWINNRSGWLENDNWEPPECFVVDPTNYDLGIRFGDVNGDGFVDILKGNSSTCNDIHRTAWINNGTGWKQDDSWQPPTCFSEASTSQDLGVVLADVNNDGLIDILKGVNSTTGCLDADKRAWINNGTGWIEDDNWESPECFVNSDGKDLGVRLFDVNGDGLVDVLKGHDTSNCIADNDKKAYINNGTSWFEDDTFEPPTCFVDNNGNDFGTRLGDLNGDGLTDIFRGRYNPSCTDEFRKAWINNGTGFVDNDNFQPPACFVDDTFLDLGYRFADVDGDGIVDILKGVASPCSGENSKAWINNASKSYLMRNITTSSGGLILIEYEKSTSYDNTGTDSQNISDIGFSVWVVANLTEDNGMNNEQNNIKRTTYNYTNGKYDYKNEEFRGFSFVNETISNKVVIKHYFHQDDAKQGREFKTEIYNITGTLFKININLFSNRTQDNYFIVELKEQSEETYDGSSSNPRRRNITYSYDIYGNILSKNDKGDIRKSGDEKYERFEYVNNTNLWIYKVKRYALFDDDNITKVRESLFSYDNLAYQGIPIKGNPTTKQDYSNIGNNITTNYTYDSYGNIITEKDPNGKVTTYTFGIRDLTFTYADRITNAKNQVINYDYDLGSGNLKSQIDSNRFITNYTYDAFNRISKEVLPFDNLTYPTKKYEYDFNGTAPEKVKISQRELSRANNTFDTYYFYDGFGRLIQIKRESETKQITQDIYYDNLSSISRQSNPYSANFNDNYTGINSSVSTTNYTYDALNRIIKVTNPDKTSKRIFYNRWNITVFDENNNNKTYKLDAHQRIEKIEEFNGRDIYNTTYQYDSADNIIKITDSENNAFNFAYDALGRRTGIDDPDLGIWNYTYDSAGNLLNQTDNRNKTIKLTYDELNRVTLKNSTTGNVSYVYDSPLNGTLSREITSASNFSAVIRYTYDPRLRKIGETKTINNVAMIKNWTYDSANRVNSYISPNNTIFNYTYNNQSELETISGFLTNINYSEMNNPLIRAYNNSLETEFVYNLSNFRLTRIKTGNLQDLNYRYDNVGNVKQINDTASSRNEDMTYDNIDRLTRTIRNDNGTQQYAINYSYNSIGNVLSVERTDGDDLVFSYNSTSPAHMPVTITASTISDKIYIRNSAGSNQAWFDYSGNIIIEGSLEQNSNKQRSSSDEWIISNNGNDVLIFDITTGSLYIDGTVFENQATLTPLASSNDFIVKDSNGNVVLYVNQSGSMFMKGTVTGNATLGTKDNVLFVRNSSNVDVVTIDDQGNMVIKGTLQQNSAYIRTNNDEWIIRNNNEDVLILDKVNGNLYIDQRLYQNQASLSESTTSDDFIVKDNSGNIVLIVNETGSMFLKGSLNENGVPIPTSESITSSTRKYNYTYDANGNVIQDESNYYEYNDFNQLIRVRGNNSQGAIIEEYFYNGNNERLMKISYLGNNTNNTEYYFDETFVKRVNSTGTYNEEYIYHKETLIGKINPNGIKEFSHPDHLGSTSLTTNSSGSLIEETTYYPYGEIFEGGNNSRYTYTGKELDRSDLYYYGQRYYSPSILMRFTQADSLIQNIYNPQALNRYSYVLNNPYKYVDPDGEDAAEVGINLLIGIDIENIPGGKVISFVADLAGIPTSGGVSIEVGDYTVGRDIRNDPKNAEHGYYGSINYGEDFSGVYAGISVALTYKEDPKTLEELKEQKLIQKGGGFGTGAKGLSGSLSYTGEALKDKDYYNPSAYTYSPGFGIGATYYSFDQSHSYYIPQELASMSTSNYRNGGSSSRTSFSTVRIKGGLKLQASSGFQEKLKEAGLL